MITQASLKKELNKLGIKTYRNKAGKRFVKKGEVTAVLKALGGGVLQFPGKVADVRMLRDLEVDTATAPGAKVNIPSKTYDTFNELHEVLLKEIPKNYIYYMEIVEDNIDLDFYKSPDEDDDTHVNLQIKVPLSGFTNAQYKKVTDSLWDILNKTWTVNQHRGSPPV